MGLTPPQAYRYVLLPNAYRASYRHDVRDDEPGENSAIASTIGPVDMAAQAGNRWITSGARPGILTAISAGLCAD